MSAKMKIRNVRTASKSTRRAGVSNSSCDCRKKQDPAVEGVQEAGKELSEIFRQLKNEEVAEKLVRAIRSRDAKTINCLLDCDCRVVNFFSTREFDCVRISCRFGRYNDVVITFDICVRRVRDEVGGVQNRNSCCWF
ncbi:hypothetical protein [Paenibacillus arenilitoris]|uniref:Uncharacterized protein n=1 Tax=Paenibacillus arenilitoris TaxID=2772299 RepID=A0A927CSF4_9BACL|nr:hypothetical protein [Paenibacillus arenilitoris]MBD2872904.1 hypothetical protein [Paenibacillus arenilitoris]